MGDDLIKVVIKYKIVTIFLQTLSVLVLYYSMSHETGPGQNQKKTESKKVLEYKSCTLTLPWTLFMTGQKADWFIQGVFFTGPSLNC